MSKAGYAPTTASRTNKLTRTKGWKELMDKHMPDSSLSKKHRELLNKKEILIVSDGAKNGSHLEYTEQPHSDVAKALDMAYKLKGHYADKDGGNMAQVVIVNISKEAATKYEIQGE